MKLCELPNDFTPKQFMKLDKASLDQVPYERMKWQCQCKGCTNGTHVRDYGISPFFFLDRNSKWIENNINKGWSNLNRTMWLCNKHKKFFEKLVKLYGADHTYKRLIDFKAPLHKLIKVAEFKTTQQIEKK